MNHCVTFAIECLGNRYKDTALVPKDHQQGMAYGGIKWSRDR